MTANQFEDIHNTIKAHVAKVEVKTDESLAKIERAIEALRALRHTAIWLAAGLIVAAYVIFKVL